MRYDHSHKFSEECLRLVLPHIAKHSLAVNPVSYAVWYEYVSGVNPALKDAIDQRLADGQTLTDETMVTLFDEHVSPCSGRRMRHVHDELQKIVTSVAGSMSQVGDRAAAFDNSLEAYDARLNESVSGDALGEIIAGLKDDTRHMHEANDRLKGELEASTEEIDGLRKELESARQEALIDPLTGLVNRKGFDEAFASAMTGVETDHLPCLLMVDIDHFKQVNDTYGHLLGDKVIRAVADTIRASVKGKDTASRFGGEEFAVLLPNTSAEGARAVAEGIRAAVEKGKIRRLDSGEVIGDVTVSVGVAAYRRGEALTDLVERADQALYFSKQNGRNRVTWEEELGAASGIAAKAG